MAFNASTTTPAVPDIEVAQPPSDSISSLSWSSQADYLAVGSWDNSVRIYEVGQGGNSQGKAMYQHEGPVLSEGNKIFSGGADNAGRQFDVATGQATQVAQHDAPIKVVKWVDAQGGILATGSWDKTIKYWDLRSSQAVATVSLPERCYSMDIQYPLMVVGTAERHIQIYNLNSPTTVYKSMQSPLKWQTRVVSCFTASPANQGFAVGSVEGRVAIHNNFSFKCHRRDSAPNAKDGANVFAINEISWHPVHVLEAMGGLISRSDVRCSTPSCSGIHFWDKDARNRLKTFDQAPGPISASAFNRNGSIFAYSISYDWSKGHAGMTPGHPNKIMLHACTDQEVNKRPRK
ncbi:Poly(A)+ RNA export protein [Mycena chlorophos]|uniref:Poly(A)+ RNA export protein n=1 Tax=Mycena chlorophos TaxID=658473 RepID=A0A8H6WHG9_MYCCL|nr:Poly(A)+ RNA export protein [Mycena chlorophos]